MGQATSRGKNRSAKAARIASELGFLRSFVAARNVVRSRTVKRIALTESCPKTAAFRSLRFMKNSSLDAVGTQTTKVAVRLDNDRGIQ
jgi:hypothetical protein